MRTPEGRKVLMCSSIVDVGSLEAGWRMSLSVRTFIAAWTPASVRAARARDTCGSVVSPMARDGNNSNRRTFCGFVELSSLTAPAATNALNTSPSTVA